MHTSKKIVAGIGGLALVGLAGLALTGCTITTPAASSTRHTAHHATASGPKAASKPAANSPAAITPAAPAAVTAAVTPSAAPAAGVAFVRPATPAPAAAPAATPAATAPSTSDLYGWTGGAGAWGAPTIDGLDTIGAIPTITVTDLLTTFTGECDPGMQITLFGMTAGDPAGGALLEVANCQPDGQYQAVTTGLLNYAQPGGELFLTQEDHSTQQTGPALRAWIAVDWPAVGTVPPPGSVGWTTNDPTPPASTTPPATPSTPATPPATVLPLALTTATASAPLTLTEGSTTPQTITGTGPAGAMVTVQVISGDGTTITLGTPTVAADGTWAVDFDASSLADGVCTINAATPTETAIGQLNIVPDAPVITAVDEGPAGDLEPVISGTALPDASITITGTDASGNPATTTAAADASGAWSLTLPQSFQPGNGLTATQTDDGYGLTSASVAVTAPALSPLALAIDGDNLDLSNGTPGATVEVAQDGLNPTRTEVTLGADGTATTPATVTDPSEVQAWVVDPTTGRLGMLITG